MKSITIIDYGMGVLNLYNCLKFLGYNPIFTQKKNIKFSILPGVGAFNQAMKLIKEETFK